MAPGPVLAADVFGLKGRVALIASERLLPVCGLALVS